MKNNASIQQFMAFLVDERNSAAIYQVLADLEKDAHLKEVYQRMAAVEIDHAKKWEARITALGGTVPPYALTFRTKTLIWLAKKMGSDAILQTIVRQEQNGASGYMNVEEAKDMAAQEKSHAFLMNEISSDVQGGVGGGTLARMEGRHRSAGGNALRAAVLGANDGLVSNLSLVMGVAGADLSNSTIFITGMAGLLAGACSMALGEWLSVQSSRELYTKQITIEKDEIETAPEEEAEELALIYEARGLDGLQARDLADRIMSNKENALDTLAREELGVDPDELGGSAWEAAITSFLLFSVGAIIPVLPFIFSSGNTAILFSIALSAVGLFVLGAAITLFTGRSVLFSGTRMVVFGLLAAAVTFGIGKLIGVSIGG